MNTMTAVQTTEFRRLIQDDVLTTSLLSLMLDFVIFLAPFEKLFLAS